MVQSFRYIILKLNIHNNILASIPLYTNTVIYRPKVVAKQLIASKHPHIAKRTDVLWTTKMINTVSHNVVPQNICTHPTDGQKGRGS